MPAIYVNDNFGAWKSTRDELLEAALEMMERNMNAETVAAGDVRF